MSGTSVGRSAQSRILRSNRPEPRVEIRERYSYCCPRSCSTFDRLDSPHSLAPGSSPVDRVEQRRHRPGHTPAIAPYCRSTKTFPCDSAHRWPPAPTLAESDSYSTARTCGAEPARLVLRRGAAVVALVTKASCQAYPPATFPGPRSGLPLTPSS